MTARRIIAIGLGGAAGVIMGAFVSGILGNVVRQVVGVEWTGHATLHIVFGVFAFLMWLWAGRAGRSASGWAERGITAVRLIAFVVGATAVVEGVGAYPPLEALHGVVYANVVALLVLLGGLLFVAAVGVTRLIRGDPASAVG